MKNFFNHLLESSKKSKLKVGPSSQQVADMTMTDSEQESDLAARKKWRSKLRPTGKQKKVARTK